jgi:hypothetical protein
LLWNGSKEIDAMSRARHSSGSSAPTPAAPWLVGAMIGMTILTMATSAMTVGAGLAIGSTIKPK